MMESELVDDVFASTLRDGVTVLLRRLEPADIDAVIALHDTLSDRERYLRFFMMHPAYLKAVAHKLTEGNGEDYALGAFESGILIGVANYVVCGRPAIAEVAIVVAHHDHLRGVGTVLLLRLAQVARANGIQRFVAGVLTTNHLMFKVLRDAALQPRRADPTRVSSILKSIWLKSHLNRSDRATLRYTRRQDPHSTWHSVERRPVQPFNDVRQCAARSRRQRVRVDRRPADAQQHLREPLIPKTSTCTASRVSTISSGAVTGQLAKPSAVALSSTRLVASPAHSRASASCSLVPSAKTAAQSSPASVSGGCANAGPANTRGGIGAVGSDCGALRAGAPASDAYHPLQVVSSVK
jgi:GNAT superfamily N-acetyltransferase